MLSRMIFALCLCWAMLGGALICAAKQPADIRDDLYYAVNPPVRVQPQNRQEQRSREVQRALGSAPTAVPGLPRLSVKPATLSPPIEEYFLAAKKVRLGRQHLEAGRDEEAVRLFAESLAEFIGLQKSAPDFAPEILPLKIREVRLQLEKSLQHE